MDLEIGYDLPPAIAVVAGALNTEAKCGVYIATPLPDPDKPCAVPASVVTEELREHGAFDLTDPHRFNVTGILGAMDPTLVTSISGIASSTDRSRTLWITKQNGPVYTIASAWAGAMLDASVRFERPTRRLLSEKREPVDETDESFVSAISARIAILAAIQSTRLEDGLVSFPPGVIVERLEPFGVKQNVVYRHLAQLRDAGIVEKNGQKKNIQTVVDKDGRDSLREITNLFVTITGIAEGSTMFMKERTHRGYEIIKDRGLLPILIERSYKSSGHTGKTSTHRR